MRTWLSALLILGAAIPAMAQRVSLRGQPISVHLVDGQGFDAPMHLALVIWDGERKLLISGTSRDRRAMAQVMALLKAEIEDGDQDQVEIMCTRRAVGGDGGQTRFPTAYHSHITSLKVEDHLFQGKCWSNF